MKTKEQPDLQTNLYQKREAERPQKKLVAEIGEAGYLLVNTGETRGRVNKEAGGDGVTERVKPELKQSKSPQKQTVSFLN